MVKAIELPSTTLFSTLWKTAREKIYLTQLWSTFLNYLIGYLDYATHLRIDGCEDTGLLDSCCMRHF